MTKYHELATIHATRYPTRYPDFFPLPYPNPTRSKKALPVTASLQIIFWQFPFRSFHPCLPQVHFRDQYARLVGPLQPTWCLSPRGEVDDAHGRLQPALRLGHWIHQSVIISREGLILTLSILPCPQGRIFWSTPCRKIDAERLSVLHQNSGGIGKSIPSALQISLGLRPWDISRVSGNLSGVGDGFPNTSLVLVEHGYNTKIN